VVEDFICLLKTGRNESALPFLLAPSKLGV